MKLMKLTNLKNSKNQTAYFLILFSIAILLFSHFTSSVTTINSCQTLSSPNTYYQLNQSINYNNTCFTISANNITLDCNGYQVTGNESANSYGIDLSDYIHTKVENCNYYNY